MKVAKNERQRRRPRQAFSGRFNFFIVVSRLCVTTALKWKLASQHPILSSQMKKLNENIFFKISNQDADESA